MKHRTQQQRSRRYLLRKKPLYKLLTEAQLRNIEIVNEIHCVHRYTDAEDFIKKLEY